MDFGHWVVPGARVYSATRSAEITAKNNLQWQYLLHKRNTI